MVEGKILNIDNINLTFGGLQALRDVNLEVKEGSTHAIIGPNGAGKSTLLNVCIGRLLPDTGKVTFNGFTLTGMKPYKINRAGVARVFQTPEIFPDISLLQNVTMPAFAKRDGSFRFRPFNSMASEKRVREESAQVLEDVGLGEYIYQTAGSLSRGDKRRLELAMCLVQHPELLFLDEPTAGMSRHDTNRTIELLQGLKEHSMIKVIIEHDMHVVFSLASRISVLARGRIIADGTPDEIRGNAKVQEAYLGGAEL